MAIALQVFRFGVHAPQRHLQGHGRKTCVVRGAQRAEPAAGIICVVAQP